MGYFVTEVGSTTSVVLLTKVSEREVLTRFSKILRQEGGFGFVVILLAVLGRIYSRLTKGSIGPQIVRNLFGSVTATVVEQIIINPLLRLRDTS